MPSLLLYMHLFVNCVLMDNMVFCILKYTCNKHIYQKVNILRAHFLFSLNFNFCYLKLVISQSKFSGTRKFTLRYQLFELSSILDIRVSKVHTCV